MGKFPVPMPPPGEMIRRRRETVKKRGVAVLGLGLCALGMVLWLVFSQAFLLHRNQGLGMFPAVKDGDLVLACRIHQNYQKGDVVVYRQDRETHLGRIGALEGDVVMMDDSGRLLVNGSIQNGQSLYPTYARANTVYPQRVQKGTVFVLGDFRTQTQDSRDFGPIPLDAIEGRAIAIVRRRGL